MSSWVERLPRNNGDLILDRASELNVVRTEHQVAPHAGFKAEAVHVNYPIRSSKDGERTMILARPPAWTEAEGLNCAPTAKGRLGRRHMDRWDTPVKSEAERLCAGCPVQDICLAAAVAEERGLSAGNRYMVRGGVTPQGRVRLERQLGMMNDGGAA
jgi:hypothetical protein